MNYAVLALPQQVCCL